MMHVDKRSHRKYLWYCAVWLLLLALVAGPAAAAPLAQEPTPPVDDGTLDPSGFIEFGPPNPNGLDLSIPAAPYSAPFAAVAVQAIPAGDKPSYDDEILAAFSAASAVEFVRQLAVDIGPRLTGTPQELQGAQHFGSALQAFGYDVKYQSWPTNRTQTVGWVTSPNAALPGGPNWEMSSSTSALITTDANPVQGDVIYCGNGQAASNFPPEAAGKIVMVDYSNNSATRNTAVVNAVTAGAIAVILAQTGNNSAPPGAFSLATPQPGIPVVGGGRAHGDWIKGLLAQGPLTLRIVTNRYPSAMGSNAIGIKHAAGDPSGTTAPIMMIDSHIDSVLGGPGAHDNASGVGVAYEVARVLSQYQFDKEIQIGTYGGEEIGMVGSHYYANNLSAAERARYIGDWDFDMAGTPYAPAAFWALTPDGRSNIVVQSGYDAAVRAGFTGLRNCKLGQSDHQSFYDVGIPAAMFIWLDYRPPASGDCVAGRGSYVTEPQYHRPTDLMDNVSPERVQVSLDVVGGAFAHTAMNAVKLTATPAGATIEGNCGDGMRYFGQSDATGALVAYVPHVTCDFKATTAGGVGMSWIKGAAIAGDRTLAFPPVFAPAVTPNPVLLFGVATVSPNVSFAAVDATVSCGSVDTASVGAKTVSCTVADNEGNNVTKAAAYNVIYAFSNFTQPVDNPPALNTANSGQAIPLKWRITDANGKPVRNLKSVVVTAADLACDLGSTADQVEEYAPGASGLLNLGNGYYQFNWKTPKTYANSCKTMQLDLGEGPGMERTAFFQFTR